jgi:hypothetical protein
MERPIPSPGEGDHPVVTPVDNRFFVEWQLSPPVGPDASNPEPATEAAPASGAARPDL